MTRGDRLVVSIGILTLVAIAGAMLLLPPPPDRAPAASTPVSPPVVHILRDGVVGSIATLDPLFARSRAELDVDALVFSGLTRSGPNGTTVADLAASWTTSKDGRTWTFHLRPGATWHDGVPVTADDVVFTVHATQDPGYAGPLAGAWQGVTATRTGRLDVQLTLAAPVADFTLAATSPILPAHLLSGHSLDQIQASTFERQPVGTGPFRLVSLDDASAVLRRAVPLVDAVPTDPADALTWQASTELDEVHVQLYADQAALADAFAAGDVDAAGGLPPADAARLASQPGVQLVRYPRSVLTSVMLNLRFGRNVFQDAHVRRALLLAIDRDAIVTDVLHGLGTRAETLIPPASWAYDAKAAGKVPHDTKAAAKELAAAGWVRSGSGWLRPGAKGRVSIELLTLDAATNPVTYAAASRVAADWKRIGIAVKLTALPADQVVGQRIVPGTYDAAVVDMNVGLDADLYPLLASAQVLQGGSNLSGYQSVTLDRLLEQARAYASRATRVKRLAAVQAELAKSLPVLPLAYADYLYVVHDDVQGPAPRLISDPGERYWDVLTWRLAKPAGR